MANQAGMARERDTGQRSPFHARRLGHETYVISGLATKLLAASYRSAILAPHERSAWAVTRPWRETTNQNGRRIGAGCPLGADRGLCGSVLSPPLATATGPAPPVVSAFVVTSWRGFHCRHRYAAEAVPSADFLRNDLAGGGFRIFVPAHLQLGGGLMAGRVGVTLRRLPTGVRHSTW